MRYFHTMLRVSNLDESVDFFCNKLGFVERRRMEVPNGRFSLVFLSASDDDAAQIELTCNWDPETLTSGRNFGHLAYVVDDIYAVCEDLKAKGVTINRPPRDGRIAFIRSPDSVSIELIQKGDALAPREPWSSMPNTGTW